MAPTIGSCLCGACKISFDTEPQMTCLCYCQKCQKATGFPLTTNLLIPKEAFQATGPLRAYTSMQSVSGKATTAYFRPECSSLMYGVAESNPGVISVKMGVLEDDGINKFVPTVEINAEHKVKWLPALDGTTVFLKMPGGV